MAAQHKSQVEPYNLDPAFERACVYHACATRAFYTKIGHALDAVALRDDTAKLLVAAVHDVVREHKAPPRGTLIVLQRLRRWYQEGKVAQAQIDAAADYLDADTFDPGDAEALRAELTPVLRKRKERDAVRLALEAGAGNDGFDKVVAQIHAAERLGVQDTDMGVAFGVNALAEIDALRMADKLRTGILDLDGVMDGGLWRGALGVAVAATAGGKSMFLNHQTAVAMIDGLYCAYATLELGRGLVSARVMAALTGVPINAITGGIGTDEATKELQRLASRGLGGLDIQFFTAQATTVQDLDTWIDALEQARGRKLDLLAVDYADKLAAPKEKNEYNAMRVVYEDLRLLAVRRNLFAWTASQATRGRKDRKRIGTDDMADSINKARIADVVVTLNPREPESIEYHVAKHRNSAGNVGTQPIPHEWPFGRMAAFPVVP